MKETTGLIKDNTSIRKAKKIVLTQRKKNRLLLSKSGGPITNKDLIL